MFLESPILFEQFNLFICTLCPGAHYFLYGSVLASKEMELLTEHSKTPAIGTYQINIYVVDLELLNSRLKCIVS